jgi:hypothetical protein
MDILCKKIEILVSAPAPFFSTNPIFHETKTGPLWREAGFCLPELSHDFNYLIPQLVI